jgi:hypothetical protein
MKRIKCIYSDTKWAFEGLTGSKNHWNTGIKGSESRVLSF